MSSSTEESEFRCFVGGLSWSTTDRGLEDAFRAYSSVIDAKVMVDRDTGRSRGFGFVTFGDERSMDEAIHRLHGKDLDGRPITVNKAQPKSRGGSDRYGAGSRGGGECFKCGQPGHWARECHSGGGGGAGSGSRYSRGGGGGDRYGSGSKSDRYGVDRYRSGYGGSRSSGLDRYTGSDRYGPSESYRNGDGYAGKDSWRSSSSHRSRDTGRSDRYSSRGGQSRSDRSGPYDRPSRAGASSYDDRN